MYNHQGSTHFIGKDWDKRENRALVVNIRTFLKMTPLREAFIRIPITYSLKLLWCTAILFINTINSINAAQPQSKPRSGVWDISVEIKTPRKNGWRNRPTESTRPAKQIIHSSLQDKTFTALFHSLGSFPVRIHSSRSLLHCHCNWLVSRDVWSSSCNGQKSDCCKGRWFPILNKSFVHQNRRNEIKLAFLWGCKGTPQSRSVFITTKRKTLRKKAKWTIILMLAP